MLICVMKEKVSSLTLLSLHQREEKRTLPSGRKPRLVNPHGLLNGVREDLDGTLSALLWLLPFSRNSLWIFILEVLT
jgi:hypothetical protein